MTAKADGLAVEDVDVSNLSKKLEKAVIAFAAVIITEEDLDSVSCYLCGVCPKIVSSGMYALDFTILHNQTCNTNQNKTNWLLFGLVLVWFGPKENTKIDLHTTTHHYH